MKGSKLTTKPKIAEKPTFSSNKAPTTNLSTPKNTKPDDKLQLQAIPLSQPKIEEKISLTAVKKSNINLKQPTIQPKQEISPKQSLTIESKKIGVPTHQPVKTNPVKIEKESSVQKILLPEEKKQPEMDVKNPVSQTSTSNNQVTIWEQQDIPKPAIAIKKWNPITFSPTSDFKTFKKKYYLIQRLNLVGEASTNLLTQFIQQFNSNKYRKCTSFALKKLTFNHSNLRPNKKRGLFFILMRMCPNPHSLTMKKTSLVDDLWSQTPKFFRSGYRLTKSFEFDEPVQFGWEAYTFRQICKLILPESIKINLTRIAPDFLDTFADALNELSKRTCLKDTRIHLMASSFYEHLGIQEALNNLKLTSLSFDEDGAQLRTTTSFVNYEKLERFGAQFSRDHTDIIQEMVTQAPNVKEISIGDGCFNEVKDPKGKFTLREDISLLLGNVSKFTKLESLSMVGIDNAAPEGAKDIDLMNFECISLLPNLKKFVLKQKANSQNKSLINIEALGESLGKASQLENLTLHLHTNSKSFSSFLNTSSKNLENLKELDLNFEFDNTAEFGKEFETWMLPKQKLRSLSLCLGVVQAKGSFAPISMETMTSVMTGIGAIIGLKYLNLIVGVDSIRTGGAFKRIQSTVAIDLTKLLQKMLKSLSNLRGLLLKLENSFWSNTELKAVLEYVRSNRKISRFGLGGDFCKLNLSILDDFISREIYRFEELYIDKGTNYLEGVDWNNVKRKVTKKFGEQGTLKFLNNLMY